MDANEYRSFLEGFDLDSLLSFFKTQAVKGFDGHYTILSFTAGHKAAFGTPDLSAGQGYNEVLKMPAFSTLKDAVIDALMTGRSFYADRDSAALSRTIREQAVEQLPRVDAYDKMQKSIERYIAVQIERAKDRNPQGVQPMIAALAGIESVAHSVIDNLIAEGKFRDCVYSPSWLAGVAWEWLECLRPWRDKHFWPAVGESTKQQERDVERQRLGSSVALCEAVYSRPDNFVRRENRLYL